MKIGEIIQVEERQPLWLPFQDCAFHGKAWMHPQWGCLACWAEHAKPTSVPEPEPTEVPAGGLGLR